MPRSSPLPPPLAATPFTVADARARGIGRGRLRGLDLERPFHGVRTVDALSPLHAYVPRLRPQQRFSHTSALAWWGAPLPSRWLTRVHVATPAAGPDAPRTRGVTGHQVDGGAVVQNGVLVSDPITAFLESASLLSVDELVAVGDYLVLDPRVLDPQLIRPLAGLSDLSAAALGSRAVGVRKARAAASLVRPGVESPKETELRLLLTRAGLPEPACGFELRSGRRHLGWFDLAWPEYRVIAEYDGDQHRTNTDQYERDIARFDEAADADWRVVRVRRRGLEDAASRTIARVRAALESRGWRSGRKSTRSPT